MTMPDITTQVAQLQVAALQARDTLYAIDELLSGPKPSETEGSTIDSSIHGGVQENLQSIDDILRGAQHLADQILSTIRDDSDLAVAVQAPVHYGTVRPMSDLDPVRIS